METLWSIYKTSQTEVVGTEAFLLKSKYPNAISHDKTNTIFVEVVGSPVGAFTLPTTDGQGNLLTLDQEALLAAQYLFSEQANGMILTKKQAINLFTHPAHRLWCAEYEDAEVEQFEQDYNYVGEFLKAIGSIVTWPTFSNELTYSQARQQMLFCLGQTQTK